MVSNASREVLFMFGHTDVGCQPGSFAESLISAFAKADSINFAKLESVFPDYARAVEVLKNDPNGRELLLAG